MAKVTRRAFLAAAAAAPGLAAGCRPETHAEEEIPAARPKAPPQPSPTENRWTGEPQWGDLVGRFVYAGQPPPRAKLLVDKDVECCGKFDIRDESLMVAVGGGLMNVYVYLRTRGAPVCPELEENVPPQVLLDNRDCIFIPHCMKIWYTRQEFYVVNSDPVGQSVKFTPLGDTPGEILLAVGGEATHRFGRKQNEPVPIACVYHPWESAYILPRDNPYVDISKADGTFRIPELPAGELEFQLWHERTGYLETPQWPGGRLVMTIEPGVNDLGTIELAPALFEK